MTALSPQRIANLLQMQQNEIRYLRAVVMTLAESAPKAVRDKARDLVATLEKDAPVIVTDQPHREYAITTSSIAASDWVMALSRADETPPSP
ncbi:hypothetical protein HLH34_04315 [Gluconacetobacter azotocaptans]|uniref:Uncharacterized protein n=1 Tax=Gluconacetobacter azotocaptans TaxID=142834 RepID=A0A7W4JQQ5_9PROT|nr:hypothetical protein [Gluconacetobacter azotocaptans]MBB2189188.1 hypothetical protein [Gluconacetobacter azotocaptans]GBQ32188.1 hypothetical protein AA13594_2296 [Gluconacetobacter azotocaptans DSM 13594]